jgi:FkbM family methyltransferase
VIRFADGGWMLPDVELHLQEWMSKVNDRRDGRLLYQGHKYRKALSFCEDRSGAAVDVGAHVGLWSWQMAKDFARVEAFEPVSEHCDCWEANMRELSNARLHRVALGREPGTVTLRCRTPGSSGDTGVDPVAERSTLRASVDPDGGEPAPMIALDSLALDGVSFMKLDCEGYELRVLEGAIETLRRNRPVLVVEQKPQTGMTERYGFELWHVVDLLSGLGARQRGSVQGDYFFSW